LNNVSACERISAKAALGEIKRWGRCVMSWWIFFIGMIVLYCAIAWRFVRRVVHQYELARLEEEIKHAKFWNWQAGREQKDLADKIAEYKNWRNNIEFELINSTAIIVGAAMLLVAALLWIGEDPSHTWDVLWHRTNVIASIAVPFSLAAYLVYRLIERLDKTEREISWLKDTLKEVKDHAEGMRKGPINPY
jgi:hypothetical protein